MNKLPLLLVLVAAPARASSPATLSGSQAFEGLSGAAANAEVQPPPSPEAVPAEARPEPAAPFSGVNDGALGADLPTDLSKDFPDEVRIKTRLLLPPPGTDFDHDGLVDAAETELAYAFRPLLVFDSHENARPAGEPVTLFQVRPVGCAGPMARCDGKPLVLVLHYLNLWTRDGGYGPASTFCGNKHKGDNQPVTVTVQSDDSGGTFRITSVGIGEFQWPTNSGAVQFLGGTHFWLYLSSGKHHHFFDTRNDHRASPYSQWSCHESVDGKGFFDLAHLRAPRASGLEWNNAGEPESHPASRFVSDLGVYRFPGEGAWLDKHFCGGLPCGKDNPTSRNSEVWRRDPFFIP